MIIQSQLTLTFRDYEEAKIFYDSFMPEFETLPMKRTKWNISPPKPTTSSIFFEINSKDGTAYRATINSLLIFSNTVEKIQTLIQELS